MTRSEVFGQVRDLLVELFELDSDEIQGSSTLYEDLELDSIDAVDLVVRLQNITNKKFSPEDFKSVRTVDDVVDAVMTLLQDA
ncbi:Acyl carrier protein [Vibrio stylophorae]|uniref:Acyl carrier protein n=1 Tax=Vibrio stylophorae TaxID=659351 RepID=A0ABN8DYW0_9VIBR|nr:acyl carrier protein [Vibrio stylophorae]CAH0533969.1 Acyl carrier protein [Vibrio stylophorae]